MEEKKKMLSIQKMPLEMFIMQLIDVYNEGADFIDIVGIKGTARDTVTIEVKPEYMAEGGRKEEDLLLFIDEEEDPDSTSVRIEDVEQEETSPDKLANNEGSTPSVRKINLDGDELNNLIV